MEGEGFKIEMGIEVTLYGLNKKGMNLKKSKEGYTGGFGARKRKKGH